MYPTTWHIDRRGMQLSMGERHRIAQEWNVWACTFLLVAETSYRYNFMCRMNGDEASIAQDIPQLVVCNDVM